MTPATIYYGSAASLRREIGLAECYQCKWQIVPYGKNGEEFTPDGFSSKSEMMFQIADYQSAYPDAEFVFHY